MSNIELPKSFEAKDYEDKLYKKWEESGLFNPDICVEKGYTQPNASPYSIVLPPPNVTGTLHMGHAAMLAIQDVLIRYHRMKGDRTLWIPGTDHAAIATESKVEKLLIDTGMKKPKEELGREAFLKEVEKFAQDSHDTIVNQAKKMGASLDWSREAYTLDAQRNLAVRTMFKNMYEDGLIYRGDRIVNWDPVMQSNVADDEIEYKEEVTEFYYFQYGPFVIGTARPETKFGDKYVVVHPDDERYAQYKHGDTFTCEWINGPIDATVIKDEMIDMNFGSGVMTITPWHSFEDFELANKYGLDKEQIIDMDGKLLPIAQEFAGMPIDEVRKKIVEKLKQKGLLVKVEENYKHNVAVNYRGGVRVEPQIRKQWFIDVNKKIVGKGIFAGREVSLKEMMQEVVRSGNTKIVPERFEKTYFHWIDNLRDWCISRQIWFGHRIPVWYCGAQDIRRVPFFHDTVEKIIAGKSNRTYRVVDYGLSVGTRAVFEDSSTGKVFGYGTITHVQHTTVQKIEMEKELDGTIFGGSNELIKRLKSFRSSGEISEQTGLWVYEYTFDSALPDEKCGAMMVLKQQPTVCTSCGSDKIQQDSDTLDTWFSSGLWTLSTLGWPDSAEAAPGRPNDLQTYHPTAVLETGYDILFFWVARMILMTTYAIGDVPFKDVYLHGLVRDEQGRKMSKSLGNIIDPLEMIEKFGTDATRLSLLIGGSAGNDVKLSEEKIAGFRNFTNKLWNISRFMLLNIESPSAEVVQPSGQTLADKWILSRLDEVIRQATAGLETYQFSPVGEMLRDFTWNDLADWYLEIAKVENGLQTADNGLQQNKSEILNYILNTLLKLWHPYMPFVTEQIWQEVYGKESVLMVEKWPITVETTRWGISSTDTNQFAIIQNIITAVRSIRAQQQIEPAKKVNVLISAGEHAQILQENVAVITALARLENCQIEKTITKPDGAIAVVESGVEIFVDVSGAIDVEKEKARITKELAEVEPYIAQLEAKLAGDFTKNAPVAIVEKEQQKLTDAKEKFTKLKDQLSKL